MRIVFPKGEADVVEQLKPAAEENFARSGGRAVDAEAKESRNASQARKMKEMFRKPTATFFGARLARQ